MGNRFQSVSTFAMLLICGLCLLLPELDTVAQAVKPNKPAARAATAMPQWIWPANSADKNTKVTCNKSFLIASPVRSARLRVIVEACHAQIELNQQIVTSVDGFDSMSTIDITTQLKQGKNLVSVLASKYPGPSAICLELIIDLKDGSRQSIITDTFWKAQGTKQITLKLISTGTLAAEPWGNGPNSIPINPFDDYTQWKQALGAEQGTEASKFTLLPGYEIQLVRSAQKDEDSWVGCAFDPKGRIVIAKEKQGLLRLTLDKDSTTGQITVTKVEPMQDKLRECRGLLFAHGHLFANANNSKGLYRLTDTTGDNQFDQVKLLYESGGGVGHGRNDLSLGPDGMIYSIHGDSVKLPSKDSFHYAPSPLTFAPQLIQAGQGHVIRMDADGNKKELVAAGLRNPFGIDFNTEGEMFTYDADAEFDMGSSWYRPTRVRHLVSGADYGWRAVTGRWPPYYPDHPDSPPSTNDIGKGSPTGVRFGTKSNFPAKYAKALFILDWTYGRIMAVHMTPRGASYASRAETFAKGRPFNVTNLDFGPDGAMYVVTGGRKTKSALYRISYTGPKQDPPAQTPQQIGRAKAGAKARLLRREIELSHTKMASKNSSLAQNHRGNPDPWIRNAARIALEHHPITTQLPSTKEITLADLETMLSFARGDDQNLLAELLVKLNRNFAKLTAKKAHVALRIYELCFARIKKPGKTLLQDTLRSLEARFPDGDVGNNMVLSSLLVQLDSSTVITKTLDLIARTNDQRQQMHYLFVLRHAENGWSDSQRKQYFQALNQMRLYQGGAGMPGFIKKIKADAASHLTQQQRQALAAIIEPPKASTEPASDLPPRKLVKKWKLQDLAESLTQANQFVQGRNYERGKAMFAAASCIQCHRVGIRGTAIGPDLTFLASRFSRKDILDSILTPSKVVSEKYTNIAVTTRDGQTIVGRVDRSGDYRSPILRLITDPLNPDQVTQIVKKDIAKHQASPLSPMPTGLLDTLSRKEILDLLAYLEAGGLEKHPIYKAAKLKNRGTD
jgi:putative heme-binding domain-containing protein